MTVKIAAVIDTARVLRVHLLARMVLAVVGGYFLTAAIVSLSGAGLAALGMARSEAVVTSAMLGFVIYLAIGLWAFAEQRFWRLWVALLLAPIILRIMLDAMIHSIKTAA